jgi:hypothetical protein
LSARKRALAELLAEKTSPLGYSEYLDRAQFPERL